MTQPTPFRARISERFACDIEVDACTTLENRAARIVDVSTHGAQVRMERPYDAGARIHLDVAGDYVWADVQWAEIDRMGVKFIAPLGPEHRLSRIIEEQRRRIASANARQAAFPANRGFGRRAA